MPHQTYTLRKVWPNIPDKIIQCATDLYRLYSSEGNELPGNLPDNPRYLNSVTEDMAENTKLTISDVKLGQTNATESVGSEKSEQLEKEQSATMYLPKFVVSGASPENAPSRAATRTPGSVAGIAITETTPTPPVGYMMEQRSSIVHLPPRQLSSLTIATEDMGEQPSRNSSHNDDILETRYVWEENVLIDIDDLNLVEKYQVLKLLAKSKLYTKIVGKALCKAKLFQEIPHMNEIPGKPFHQTIQPPRGAFYKSRDFYMFAIIALFYFECDFLIRPPSDEDITLNYVQKIRMTVKEARIPICAAFAKLHIAAKVPVVEKMLTAEEQQKLEIESSSNIGNRDGLVYLFLPDEFADAQLHLCEMLGSEYLTENQAKKNSAFILEEAQPDVTDNFVSVFSRPDNHDLKPLKEVFSFLPEDKTIAYAFTIPADCISREFMLKHVLNGHVRPATEASTAGTSNATNLAPIDENFHDDKPSESSVGGKDSRTASSRALARSELKSGSETRASRNSAVSTDFNVRINYRCQDRFSIFAFYAVVNFLPTAHAGQTAAPVVAAAGNESNMPAVAVSLVITGLTSPNQLSGLVRLCHLIRLCGNLPLGPLASVFIYNIANLGKSARGRLSRITAESATNEVIKSLELFDEDFTSAPITDEECYKTVKAALVFGDLAADFELLAKSNKQKANRLLEKHQHPLSMADVGYIVDAICFAAESPHYIWYAIPNDPTVERLKAPKPEDTKSTSDVASHESSLSHVSDLDDTSVSDDSASTTAADVQKYTQKSDGTSNHRGKEETLSKSQSKQLPTGKRTDALTLPTSKPAGKQSPQSKKASPVQQSTLNTNTPISRQRVTSQASKASSNASCENNPHPGHGAIKLVPNTTAYEIFHSALHAAKLPYVQTIVLALRNVPTPEYGEEFAKKLMTEINKINIFPTVNKAAVETSTEQKQDNEEKPTATEALDISSNAARKLSTVTVGTTASGVADATNETEAAEPLKPTHRLSCKLHIVPVPLSIDDISMPVKEDRTTTFGAIPTPTVTAATPTASDHEPTISGMFFSPNSSLSPSQQDSQFVFGGYIAAISISRVSLAQAGKLLVRQRRQQQPKF